MVGLTEECPRGTMESATCLRMYVCPEEEAVCGRETAAEKNAKEIDGDAASAEENVGRSPEDATSTEENIGGESEDPHQREGGQSKMRGRYRRPRTGERDP
ncbi:hypothetical protein NDU88_001886 [Pleurodeles waltl]|uniref:Uncharacterized protein n=1 Tax=Pleurodeles waltl TaxID=8319 RepID=A0AAV7RDW2_PLEWA|nr:hypothetical protein NDU88_001886 [Pleurodeles waltl]